ncbi:MAG: DUF4430 domain-containing protein [Eubacterium sp.]
MRKYIKILICSLICLAMLGCSAQEQSAVQSTSSVTQSASVLSIETQSQTQAEKSTTARPAQQTTQKTTTASSKNTTKANQTSADEKATTKAAQSTTTTVKATSKVTTAKATTTQKTTVSKATTQSTITCYVTVECKSILDNYDDLKAGHEAYVPSDGVMINNCAVTVDNGSTAYDAVSLACKNKGIKISSKNSAYGKYIVGFNNIDEKDCGSQSGWLYKVNGSFPSKSSDKYTVSNGDNIVFTYTCSY